MTGKPDPDDERALASAWVPVLDLAATPLDAPRPVEVEGVELVLLRQGERYVAMDRWCPHSDGDLAQGRLLGKALKCPLHGFMYSVDTGRGVNCPGFAVKVHEVRVDGDLLSVRLER